MRNLVGLDISAGRAELVPESCWGVLPRGILLGILTCMRRFSLPTFNRWRAVLLDSCG
jgi:hypothetical protein